MVSNMLYTKFSQFHGLILCMQGTQFDTRGSILCMKHIVVLHNVQGFLSCFILWKELY